MDFRGSARIGFGTRACGGLQALCVSVGAVTFAALVLSGFAEAAPASIGAPRAHAGRGSLAAVMRSLHEHSGVSLVKSSTTPYWACPESLCEAIVDPPPARRGTARFALPDGGPAVEGSGEEGGIDPQELQAAYAIPTSGGEGQTVALVDAGSYKAAEADLAVYRSRYGLPACTKEHGCFRHVNASGGKPKNPKHSKVSEGWQTESALDLDMVSAACPRCHILLVDAEGGTLKELGEAVDTAVAMGAMEVSNSYGLPEEDCDAECEATFADYDHQGVFIMAASGDRGYDNYGEGAASPNYPASLPSVVAVGGTSLKKVAAARGWNEEVWWEPKREIGTGSGCASAYVGEKPAWQGDPGCTGRSDNDVAAVAACETPVSTYASAFGGWLDVCGTSAASPLVAGIEAHVGAFARSLPGADAFYHDPSALFEVTSGSNGLCSSPPGYEDLCNAGIGWNGPAGNGTPDGPLELTSAAPSASTGPVSDVTGTAATLNGSVTAGGLPTTYRFEYGTTNAYGSSVPLPAGSAGSGETAQAVSATVGELQLETIYHYRLVAANRLGVAYGRDQEFDTSRPVIESVSPSAGGRAGYVAAQISGANFVDVTAVSFGSSHATYTVNSPTSITATVPVGEREGAVNVTVSTVTGRSAPSPAAEYTYMLNGMLAWGTDEGDLGRGWDGTLSDVPIEVAGELPEVKQLAANDWSSLALLDDGEVEAWGAGRYDDIGDGRYGLQDTPVKVCAVGVSECPDGPYLQEVAQLASGYNQNLALLDDGAVVGWGAIERGELGGGYRPGWDASTPIPICMVVETPCSPENQLKGAVHVAAGNGTSYALLANGTVLAWGENGRDGALGDGKGEYGEYSLVPVQVVGLSGATSIAADSHGGLALLGNGTVESWGWNEAGTLGNGSTAEESDVPVPVCSGTGKHGCSGELDEVSAVYGSDATSYALLRNGSVMAWGVNIWDNLGDPSGSGGPAKCKLGVEQTPTPCARTPVAVDIGPVRQLATGLGETNVLALLEDGELMAWGAGAEGDLGNGSSTLGTATPEHVCAAYASGPCPHGPYLSGEVLAIAAGGTHDLVYARR